MTMIGSKRGGETSPGHWQKGGTKGGHRPSGHYGDRVNTAWGELARGGDGGSRGGR